MMLRILLAFTVIAGAGASVHAEPIKLASISALAVGPKGVLFLGDATAGAVVAVETGDVESKPQADVTIPEIAQLLAKQLETTPDNVTVNDVKVNPASGRIYLAATRGKGKDATPAVFVLDGGKFAEVALGKLKSTKFVLPNATEKNRVEAITSMAFVDGKLVVAGLSNEEFASTLRVIPFPFPEKSDAASIEIYHGAHGKYETNSPVRTFTPYKIGGADYLLAAYTCTPLVKVPMTDLKNGTKVKGTTIAELGNRNRPLDMIVYSKGGEDFILMANNARGVMKIPASTFADAKEITTPVRGGGVSGVKFETIEQLKGILQLDKYDATRAVVLMETPEKTLTLKTINLP